jgi:hypothetical protein
MNDTALAPARGPLCWPLSATMALCLWVILYTGLNAWLQIGPLRVLASQGMPPLPAMAMSALPFAVCVLTWTVLVRLWFRRSLQLAQWWVALMFLASLLALAWSFESADLDFALGLLWLAALALLFRTLLQRVRNAATRAEA